MKQNQQNDSVSQLDRDMAGKNLSGYWSLGMEGLPSDPMTSVRPCLWKWKDIYDSLVRAGDLISLENSERRVVRLVNPGLQERPFASHTLQVSFQYVKPGENARAHRHTPAALRFVLQGHGAYTTVNGQQCIMEPGDLILTPGMSWHDHSNESNEPMVWLDGLDFPLVTALHQVMQERYSDRRQPIEKDSEQVNAKLETALRHGLKVEDIFHYRWSATEKSLRELAHIPDSHDAYDGYLLEYRNPLNGGPTMTTIQCAVQLLNANTATESHRHTSTTMYHVFRGDGASEIAGEWFEWHPGDSFVVPLWHEHRHVATSQEAILFSMSDAPVLKALGLYREKSGASVPLRTK